MEINKIYNEDCQKGVKRIPDASIDCILTDPPYLYLKGHKLDRPFDEMLFFSECKRILKPSGCIVLFGRGTSFYRWNTILSDLGFLFKEECIWHKNYPSSPLLPICRIHETVSIHTKGQGVINRVKVPYLEKKKYDFDGIISDIKRLKTVLANNAHLLAVEKYICTGVAISENKTIKSSTVTISSNTLGKANRCVSIMKSITEGMNESSIIRETPEKFKTIHPTQKPVRLLERLLALTTQPGSIVCDPFSGSGSTAVACINTGRKFIGFEIDKEYYDASMERLKKALSEPKLAM